MYKSTSIENNLFNHETTVRINDIKTNHKHAKIGVCFSASDILHAGHLLMLQDAKNVCDVLIVGLHTNPNLNRDSKNRPIQDLEERMIQLKACKYVDEIITYATEDDLLNILYALQPDIRILGTDWRDKPFTGHQLCIPIHWHERNHNWSTTYLRDRIYNAESLKRPTTFIVNDYDTHYSIREY